MCVEWERVDGKGKKGDNFVFRVFIKKNSSVRRIKGVLLLGFSCFRLILC